MTTSNPIAQLSPSGTSITGLLDKVNEVVRLRGSFNVEYVLNDDAVPSQATGQGDHMIVFESASGGTQCDLPAVVSGTVGHSYLVLRRGANTVTITPDGSDTINGSGGAVTITTNYHARLLIAIAVGEWWMATLS